MKKLLYIFTLVIFGASSLMAQDKPVEEKKKDKSFYGGLKFRSIGPALMSGRISDVVIHPNNSNIWYVGVASGGVWKTENSGTTWSSIFDGQKSYSIGCISLDPQNPNIVWVGTGENDGGRHISYGDGIYKSEDGGKSWKNMGLKKSEHLSKIIIHPTNSNIMWVASQGPLWSEGGERGVYMTTDGGKTWKRTLGDDKWVGATDLLIDPRNPKKLYAATWQRHRTVAGYMGGGPGTAIYKSEDGGENWNKLTNGLPTSNMGKIGLGISYQNPDVLYAAIELNRRTGGVYRSDDQGGSWTKMSDAVAGGTGPHYYQELYVSPHQFDKLYMANNYMLESSDGGKTFTKMNEEEKHVDNHAVAFKKDDPNYILVGCDGGLYESFDKTKNWKFIDNLPITQFYKLAIDDAKPFYNVYGGTQDNNTQGGPSRTDNIHGIRNSDWYVVLGGDGHQPATEPGNPNVVYAQWQQGNLNRHDKRTGENVYIQPQPALGEKKERFNWDAPILVSPHKPSRIYHASQRVWKSEDRGDSWTPISGDLTNNIQRIQTPFYGEMQKWDNAWDIYAMSNYSTITSLSESPVKEGLIYAGTDDGIIQVTEDGGKNWRKVSFKSIKGLPTTAFVNDIKADMYDENTVYAVFDNHKYGDYQPYIYKSTDKGKKWKSVSADLPDRTLLWRVVQDHKEKDLMFLGTEFGVYFTNDGAKSWAKLKGGMPNISVRDLAIQKTENDLVLATFGRGFYILDDYSSLRSTIDTNQVEEATLFAPKKALWYLQKRILGWNEKASQGDNFFVAKNPEFGSTLTFYLKDGYKSKEEQRQKNEKELEKDKKAIGVPAWKVLEEEKIEIKPKVWLFVYDANGNIIKKIEAPNQKGYNRVTWDLTTESSERLNAEKIDPKQKGGLVSVGKYKAKLHKQINGKFEAISKEVEIEVVPLYENKHQSMSNTDLVAYWDKIEMIRNNAYKLSDEIEESKKLIDAIYESYKRGSKVNATFEKELETVRTEIMNMAIRVDGSETRFEVGAKDAYPSIEDYLDMAGSSRKSTTYGPTKLHKECLKNAETLYGQESSKFANIKSTIEGLRNKLKQLGAPEIK